MKRYVGMDVHKSFIMVAAVSKDLALLAKPKKVATQNIKEWVEIHLTSEDEIALEASSNCWKICDDLIGLVGAVKVANSHKLKIISASAAKTDRHDSIVLAKMLASGMLPEVWIPPQHVRDLRYLMAHGDLPPLLIPLSMLVQIAGLGGSLDDGFRCRWSIIQGTVRPDCIVMLSPHRNDHLGFPQRIEYLAIQ